MRESENGLLYQRMFSRSECFTCSVLRDAEQQRQQEWEKQRLQELMNVRQRQQENLLSLKAKNQSLSIDLTTKVSCGGIGFRYFIAFPSFLPCSADKYTVLTYGVLHAVCSKLESLEKFSHMHVINYFTDFSIFM